MPIVTVTLLEGYDETTRTRLAEQLTDGVRAVIDAPLDAITVVIDELPAANYMRGRTRRSPGRPAEPADQLVHQYLTAMEARDLVTASSFLADGFTMTFPGGVTFTTPEELVEWAGPRYRFVKKTYERFDVAAGAGDDHGGVAVYCFGALSGEWPDGEAFSGVRFIDRFTVKGGKLRDQMVWNDIAKVRKTVQG